MTNHLHFLNKKNYDNIVDGYQDQLVNKNSDNWYSNYKDDDNEK